MFYYYIVGNNESNVSDLGCLTILSEDSLFVIYNYTADSPITTEIRNFTDATVCDTDECIPCIVLFCITFKKATYICLKY